MVPRYAVPVRVPFLILVLSSSCNIKTAWKLSHGSKTSPFQQNRIVNQVRAFKHNCWAFRMECWNVITLPFGLWRNF